MQGPGSRSRTGRSTRARSSRRNPGAIRRSDRSPVNEDGGFLRACDLARTADENFELAWIAEIEAAWQVTDLDHGDFGFSLVRADGRRLYWRFTSEDTGAGRPEDLEVSEL